MLAFPINKMHYIYCVVKKLHQDGVPYIRLKGIPRICMYASSDDNREEIGIGEQVLCTVFLAASK